MMDIRKLQKKLLKEELKRRRQKSTFWRLILPGSLVVILLLVGGLLFHLSRLDSALEEDFAQAELSLNHGDYQEALESFQAIQRRHPSFKLAPRALFQSGEILNLYLKRYPEALLSYLTLQQEYPDDRELGRKAQQRVAEIYKHRQRDYERAVVEYRKLLDLGGGEEDRIEYEIADALFRLEKYAPASEAFERLAAEHPDSDLLPESRFRAGTVYSLMGNNVKAMQTFRDLVSRWPDNPYALEAKFSLASILEERDEFTEALAMLESLQGQYANAEALNKKIELIKERMKKKRRGQDS